MKNAANAKSRPRVRKKPEAPAPATASAPMQKKPPNMSPFEGAVSLMLGLLFLVGAVFPRSLKQLFLLLAGGGLVYRGMTNHCGLYHALGVDARKGSVLTQLGEK